MKVIVFLCLVAYASAFYSYIDTNEDVEKLMQDRELIQSSMACYTDQGPCTDKQLDAKNHLTESVMSFCGDCEPKEKQKMKTALKILIKDYPKELEAFRKKFDVDGKHFAVIAADLDKLIKLR